MGAGRQVAATADGSEPAALGIDGATRWRVLECRKCGKGGDIVGAAFDGECPLGDLGHEHVHVEHLVGAVRQAEA